MSVGIGVVLLAEVNSDIQMNEGLKLDLFCVEYKLVVWQLLKADV